MQGYASAGSSPWREPARNSARGSYRKANPALATVCSIVVNGVLLKNGIPMDSKFGGIVQISRGEPLRFVKLIHYSGSSLDPWRPLSGPG